MNSYEIRNKHEVQMQDRRRELKTEGEKLASLKKVLKAKIASERASERKDMRDLNAA
jgi:hypothetical protein